MKRLLSVAITLTVVTSAAAASAGELTLFRASKTRLIAPGTPGFMVAQGTLPTAFEVPPPAPGVGGGAPVPTPEPAGSVGGAGGAGCCLFQCVRYKDLDNIHPCAVSKIVCIVDPCWKPSKCGCCRPAPRCVQVRICVPPCGCACVKVSRNGRRVKYDYGDYEVELTSKNGRVTVDYDD